MNSGLVCKVATCWLGVGVTCLSLASRPVSLMKSPKSLASGQRTPAMWSLFADFMALSSSFFFLAAAAAAAAAALFSSSTGFL